MARPSSSRTRSPQVRRARAQAARSILRRRTIWVVDNPRSGGRVPMRGNRLGEWSTQANAIKAARLAATGRSGRRSRFGIKVHTARGVRTIRAGSPAYVVRKRGY